MRQGKEGSERRTQPVRRSVLNPNRASVTRTLAGDWETGSETKRDREARGARESDGGRVKDGGGSAPGSSAEDDMTDGDPLGDQRERCVRVG